MNITTELFQAWEMSLKNSFIWLTWPYLWVSLSSKAAITEWKEHFIEGFTVKRCPADVTALSTSTDVMI
jgi:hypothetical protein